MEIIVKVTQSELKAEWEEKGRPKRQYNGTNGWKDVEESVDEWHEYCEYRIKPTPHPDADVLRALADDGSLKINIEVTGNQYKFTYSGC
jgi:hypothetical protein